MRNERLLAPTLILRPFRGANVALPGVTRDLGAAEAGRSDRRQRVEPAGEVVLRVRAAVARR